jgi:hypothetical protein
MSNVQDEELLKAYLKGGSARTQRSSSTRDEEIQYILQAFLIAGDEARADGDLTRAERFYHETIKLAAREFDNTVPEIGLAKFHLSMLYLDRGTLVAADAFAKSALHIFIEVFGEGHPATGMAMHQLAEVHLAQDNLEEAGPLQKKAALILAKHYRGCNQNQTTSEVKPSTEVTELARTHLSAMKFEGGKQSFNHSNN